MKKLPVTDALERAVQKVTKRETSVGMYSDPRSYGRRYKSVARLNTNQRNQALTYLKKYFAFCDTEYTSVQDSNGYYHLVAQVAV
jgi:hypothetical protein